ncbi:MAG: hypothetical protein JWO92_1113 [Chitinophagaceae bacterium]|nr:hypothetical protein [Chitinophagaceae bacterium]
MKKILIAISVLISVTVKAQVQYGGQVRALNNSGTIGLIGRTVDNLKVADSINAALLSSINTKITAVNTGAVVVSSSALPALAATSTKQSDGSQKTQIVDGSGNVISATSNALDINIKSGNASSVTANAGTNLNTSLLALESGGNLASIKTNTDNLILAQASNTSGQTGNLILAAATTAAPIYTTAKSYPLSLTTAGALRVDNSGVTQPISGTVTINAIPAGTNNIGDVDVLTLPSIPAGTNNIGDVDVLTVPADPFGVNADAASATGSISAKLRFIANTGIPITGTVTVGSHAVTNAGTFATQPASATAPVSTMNSSSANSGLNTAIAGVFDDTSPTAITENSFGFIRMSANRNLFNTIRDAAGNERGANVNASNQLSVSVDNTVTVGTHAVTQSGTWNVGSITTLPALVAGSALIGKVGIDQTTVGTTNGVSISQIGATTVVNGGTAGSLSIGGMVANNGTINSAVNPVLIGGQAVSSENAANTTAKLSQFVTDLVGKLIVLPYANPENFVSGAITSAMTGTTSTSLVAAPAAGLRNYITTIIVSNSHATVGTDIIIQDGNGGTTLMTIPAASVYGGAVINLPVPLRQPTTATAIYCANVTTGASTKVTAVGYIGK